MKLEKTLNLQHRHRHQCLHTVIVIATHLFELTLLSALPECYICLFLYRSTLRIKIALTTTGFFASVLTKYTVIQLSALIPVFLDIYLIINQELRMTAFGTASCPPRGEWIHTPLVMRPSDQALGYGLAAQRNGTRSLLSALQAHIIKWLLFDSRPMTKDNKCMEPPDRLEFHIFVFITNLL